jgi:hypothetical protein
MDENICQVISSKNLSELKRIAILHTRAKPVIVGDSSLSDSRKNKSGATILI